jgi:hypothetical protein
MMFRTRLLLVFTVAIVASVGVVELLVQGTARRTFERGEARRAQALAQQFQKEFEQRGKEVVRAVNAIAASDEAVNIAISGDPARYFEEAASLAATRGLDMLELVAGDGTIVSSAQWPARFGYKEDWLTASTDWRQRGAVSPFVSSVFR